MPPLQDILVSIRVVELFYTKYYSWHQYNIYIFVFCWRSIHRIRITIYDTRVGFFLLFFSVSVYPYTLVKPVSRSATLVGSCTVWSMAFSRTDRCRRTRRSAVVTIASTRSSARPVPANMFPGRCLSTWNRPSSVILTSSYLIVHVHRPVASGVFSNFGGPRVILSAQRGDLANTPCAFQ